MTNTRKLGDAEVFPIGLGGMPMSLSSRPPEEQSIRTIHAALDAGVNFIDTADAYSADDDGLRPQRAADRQGARRPPRRRDRRHQGRPHAHGRRRLGARRPARVHQARLRAVAAGARTDRIDLYQYHRPDPDVPYAETIGAFKELQDEGKVRWIGISNANTEQIEETRAIVELVSVQNQLSLEYGSPLGKGEVELCEQHGIAFLPWSPFGGISKAADAPGAHDPVREIAGAHGVSPQQVVLAWLLALSPVMIPIPGASRPESITDSVEGRRARALARGVAGDRGDRADRIES